MNFDKKRLNFDTMLGDLLWIEVYISNGIHFIKIVVDLITLYDLSKNFTSNPHISLLNC